MDREITNKINYILDNWVPPAIRDSKWFYGLILKVVAGKKVGYYMDFKKRLPNMLEVEVNQYYTILADTFMKRNTDLNKKCIEIILDNILGVTILDAAAGKGYLVEKIKEKTGKNITALDIIIQKTKRRDIKWVEGSLTEMPFPDNSFDTVLCTHALEHIKDVKMALNELRRVCKKRLIIVVPRQREYLYTADLHINFYPYKYNVEKLFENRQVDIALINGDWLCIEDTPEISQTTNREPLKNLHILKRKE